MLKVLILGLLTFMSCLCYAAGVVPSKKADVVKLIVIDNGSQIIKGDDFQTTIADWYLGSLFSEDNEDMQQGSDLYYRIFEASCAEQKETVKCTLGVATQEFVMKKESKSVYWCHGYDSGSSIVVEFTKQPDKLKFQGVEMVYAASGGGECAKE